MPGARSAALLYAANALLNSPFLACAALMLSENPHWAQQKHASCQVGHPQLSMFQAEA